MSEHEPSFLDLLDEDERQRAEELGRETPTDIEVRLDWLLERIVKRQRQIKRNNSVAERRALMIEDWRRGENMKLENAIQWFESEVRALLPPDSKEFEREFGKKSRNLPSGTVGWRRQPDRIEVFSEEKALAWAKAMGLPIKVKETVSKTELKKAMDAGAEPDGVDLIKGLDELYIKPTQQDPEEE